MKQQSKIKLEVAEKLSQLIQSNECTPKEHLTAITLLAELYGLSSLSDAVQSYAEQQHSIEVQLRELKAERDKLLAAKELKLLERSGDE